MEIEYRPVSRDELNEFVRAESRAFGGHASDGYLRRGHATIEPDRTMAAFDNGRIVGTSTSHTYEIIVPGGSLPVAGCAWVTVQPTHRRRGVLTEMMARLLAGIHGREEPLACLWPSESIIYGRYGFGMSVFVERWTLDRQHSALIHQPTQTGQATFVEASDARKLFPPVFDRVCAQRNGMVQRKGVWWDEEFVDPPENRGGATALFYVVYQGESGVDGYLMYRIDHSHSKLMVYELIAATDEAHAGLWNYCTGVDLLRSVEANKRPVDDPLLWMLADPHRLRREPQGSLWLRIVDVQPALSRRRYAVDGRLVIEVRDATCPWNEGRFELEGGPDGADCHATTKSPDVSLDVADLAAGYFGAERYRVLRQAGRVQEHTPGALATMDAMFATSMKPWCVHDF